MCAASLESSSLCDNSYLDLPDYVDYDFSNHSLKQACRLVIRKHLLGLDSTNLFVNVPKLFCRNTCSMMLNLILIQLILC